MQAYYPIRKPAEIAEERLLEAILDGSYPPDSNLPGERELAARIGVTRPTLREALQRLARDGWLDIQHGKPTRVRDYWREGSLGVLSALAQTPLGETPDFVAQLLEVRALLAPAYTRQAVERAGLEIAALLAGNASLEDSPPAYARADWDLHHLLTLRAGNPIFCLLLNSFQDLYQMMGERYFASAGNRAHSRAFYIQLLACARAGDGARAGELARAVMEQSLANWEQAGKERT